MACCVPCRRALSTQKVWVSGYAFMFGGKNGTFSLELCKNIEKSQVFRCLLCTMIRTGIRTGYLGFIFGMAFFASASANWFNKSEQYLAACGNEASHRFHKDISSEDGRRHIHLCMIAHGYAFKQSCGEDGWLKPDCYRLKFKTEGR